MPAAAPRASRAGSRIVHRWAARGRRPAQAPDHRHIEEEFAKLTCTFEVDLLSWLTSHAERAGYCDRVLEGRSQPQSLFELICAGESLELKEVFNLVAGELEREQYRRELKAGTLKHQSGLVVIPAR